MDFDQNLSKIQGALISFPNIVSDDEKNKILFDIFSVAKEKEKPKMVFFLILNTNFGANEKIRDNGSIGLLIDTCPHLELNFLTSIILDLKLTYCLYDVVSNCPLTLSVKLLENLYFKFDDYRTEIYGLSRIICGIIEKIFKVSKGFHSDSLGFSALNEISLKYLNAFIDEVNKTKELKDNLLILNFWLNKFLNYIKLTETECGSLADNLIFQIYYERDENDNENEEASNFEFSEYVYYMCDIILREFNKILSNYDKIDVDASLLKSVCENACQLREKILNNPFSVTLGGIIEKLKTESDVKSEIDIKVLISKMNKDKPTGSLFKTIIKYPDAFENEDVVMYIRNHLNVADSNDLKDIIESIQDRSEKSEVLQNLYLSSMMKLNFHDQLFYLNKYFESGCNFLNCESSAFVLDLTEKFNKMSESVSDPSTMSCLVIFCIQSPLRTVMKMCEEALSNVKCFSRWVDNLIKFKSACLSGHYGTEGEDRDINCISYTAHCLINKDNLDEKEKRLLTKLIICLCKNNILEVRFVETLIVNVLRKEIENGLKLSKVIFVLELLKTLLKTKSFLYDKYVMMAFMSQILSHTSWDCTSFSALLAKAREIVVWIVNDLIKSSHITEGPEIRWLHQKLMKSSEINVLYFCDLWFSLDLAFVASNELHIQLLILLHTKCKTEMIANNIIKKFESKNLHKFENYVNAALIKILPILTVKEWISLFTHLKLICASLLKKDCSSDEMSLKVFKLFKDSIYVIALDMNQNGDIISCFEFSIRNFARLIQQSLLSEENLAFSVCRELLIGLLFILNGICDVECRKLNSLILSPIILELINRLERNESQSFVAGIQKLESWFKTNFI